MKVSIELEGNDPLLPAVLALLSGTAVAVSGSPEVVAPVQIEPPTVRVQPKAKDPEPKADEGNGSAASSDAPDQPKTTAPSQASTSAPSKEEEGKIDLPKLQALAAQLLEAGERRTLKSILDENGVKSLSTAPEDAYEMLFGALGEAVKALPAA